MAKTTAPAVAEAPTLIEVRLLQDSHLGRVDSVVEVLSTEVAGLSADGLVDHHPDAVAYAKSLAAR